MKKTHSFYILLIILLATITCGCSKQNENDVQNHLDANNIEKIIVFHGGKRIEYTPGNAAEIIHEISDFLQYPSNFMGTTDGEISIENMDSELTGFSESDYHLVIILKNAMSFSFCDDMLDRDSLSTWSVYGFCYIVTDSGNDNALYLSTDVTISDGGTFGIGAYSEYDLSGLNQTIIESFHTP